ncbi:hypothetical protein SAMN02799631_00572 [Methylobacterium sp. 174MFSha1.1]|uniref:hypothetical protein n=1 Tax=Methylobacterium sp. 174MFSha1.1 TaxID=1502749 RepID=UPI0008E4FEE0|nr:hypothetical protein [Methylobacterium sp. 174MFSha1.1]SFU41718.1 hypothetical protein SAMN02799631_00572 [Methylobacterium sp. 174MFSha1.1]
MRTVVDEGVPRQLVQALRDYGIDASRFPRHWAALGNGALIRTIEEAGFAVLVTNDKNMAHQQSLRGRTIAIVALPYNKRRLILERAEAIADTITQAGPGEHVAIGLDGRRLVQAIVDGVPVSRELSTIAPFKMR